LWLLLQVILTLIVSLLRLGVCLVRLTCGGDLELREVVDDLTAVPSIRPCTEIVPTVRKNPWSAKIVRRFEQLKMIVDSNTLVPALTIRRRKVAVTVSCGSAAISERWQTLVLMVILIHTLLLKSWCMYLSCRADVLTRALAL
jgi:hypothetical protein